LSYEFAVCRCAASVEAFLKPSARAAARRVQYDTIKSMSVYSESAICDISAPLRCADANAVKVRVITYRRWRKRAHAFFLFARQRVRCWRVMLVTTACSAARKVACSYGVRVRSAERRATGRAERQAEKESAMVIRSSADTRYAPPPVTRSKYAILLYHLKPALFERW